MSILQCYIRRRKGMELPINTIVILVVLLVLVVVVLILVSRGGSNFVDFGEDMIGIACDVSECERLCWGCSVCMNKSSCSSVST